MKVRINLDTGESASRLCRLLENTSSHGKTELVSGDDAYRVNAKSYLGCLLAHTEWGSRGIWFEADDDKLYSVLDSHGFIIVEANDGAFIHE